MGRSRRRYRHRRGLRFGGGNGHGGNGHGGNGHGGDSRAQGLAGSARLMTERLAATFGPLPEGHPVILAPVLELEGLDPWAEIRGPALALEESAGEAVLPRYDDPWQLELEPAAETGSSRVARDEIPDAVLSVNVADLVAATREASLGSGADVAVLADTSLSAPAVIDVEPFDLVVEAAAPVAVDGAVDSLLGEPQSEAPALFGDCDDAPALLDAPALDDGSIPDPPPAAETEAPPAPAPAPAPDPIEALYAGAREAADGGEPARAEALYRQLLAQRPTHVRARNNLALLLDAAGNHQAALAELDRALDVEPDNATLLVNRGALLGAMGRFAAAERDLKKVLRVEPSHAEALFNLGVVMSKKALWGEAVPLLQRAVELEPNRAAAHYYLGEALNHIDDLAGALTSYQRAAELQPDNPRALYGLGIIYDRLARPDDAAHMYRRSREVGRR